MQAVKPNKKKAIWIFFGLALVLFVVFLTTGILWPKKTKAIIEWNRGPFWYSGLSIVGLLELTPNSLLVATREQGIIAYDTERNRWNRQQFTPHKDSWKVAELSAGTKNIYVITTDGSVQIFSRRLEALQLLKSPDSRRLTKTLECGNHVIVGTEDQLYLVAKNKLEPFQVKINGRIRALACYGDQIAIGTEGGNLFHCSIMSMSCRIFHSNLPIGHVSAIAYLSNRNSWLIAPYGNAGQGILELNKDSWRAVGQKFGDTVQFIAAGGQEYPYALTDSGFLFKYAKGRWEMANKQYLFSPPAISLKNGNVLGASGGSLVELEAGRVKQKINLPLFFEPNSSLLDREGNTFIWDIGFIAADGDLAILAATGQAGVWWSSDYGKYWTKLGENLPDDKIHFIKYDPGTRKLLAGTHSRGLFICDMPCSHWREVADKRLPDADLQDIACLDQSRYLIAAEQGAFFFDAKSEKITALYHLKPKGYSIESNLWTVQIIDGRYYFGVYAKPGTATGIWELEGSKFLPIVKLPYSVKGIIEHDNGLLVGTLNGLFFCRDSTVKQLNQLSINRMAQDKNRIWLATDQGVFHIPASKPDTKPEIITEQPSQSVAAAPFGKHRLIVGTRQQGVITMRIKND